MDIVVNNKTAKYKISFVGFPEISKSSELLFILTRKLT